MSHAQRMRERLPSWVHEDGSVVRLKTAAPASSVNPFMQRAPDERRLSARIPVELTVFVHAADAFFQAETADISTGGMFLVTERALPIGTRVVLDFGLSGNASDGEMEVHAVVCWARSEIEHARSGAPRGLAMEFVDVSAEAAERLEAYCKVREPLYFDLFEGAC